MIRSQLHSSRLILQDEESFKSIRKLIEIIFEITSLGPGQMDAPARFIFEPHSIRM
jgi:hypothetical protein